MDHLQHISATLPASNRTVFPMSAAITATVTVLGCSVSASFGAVMVAIALLALGLAIFEGDRDLCGRPTGFLYNL